MNDAFFMLHQGLDREGPGSAEDVAWVADLVGLAPDARVCDAACGPGGDTQAWLARVPDGHVTAVDSHSGFIDELLARVGPEDRLTAYVGDMAKLKGPFDLIWCAGAVYFLGIDRALTVWRPCLADGGAIAFSEPCLFDPEGKDAAEAYFEGYGMRSEAEIRAVVEAAKYSVVETRRVSDAGWSAYHATMARRIAELRPVAEQDNDTQLIAVLDEAEKEIADWQHVKDLCGYLLLVVRPK